MNALAQPASPSPSVQPTSAPLLRTLALCDLVDSTALVERLGDQRAAMLFRKHDRLVRELLGRCGGREIDKTDGFLLMFERPVQAVAFALDYQRALRQVGAEEQVTLASRVGIHVGDIVTWDNEPGDVARGAKPVEVEGLVKPIASRLTQLALPGQILLSGIAHALVFRAQSELGERLATTRWRTHGRYRFKGIPDPIPVFEVGEEGAAPLKAPPWSGKAHREVPFWRRPATLVVECLILLALVAIPAWYLIKPEPAIAFAKRDWVVVGDLKNLTDQPNFDDSVDAAFRIGLEQSRYVNVMSSLKTRETVRLMQHDPEKTAIDRAIGSEVAIRDGARALILPTVAEIGGRVRVTAEVVDPNTQTTVWSESADGIGAGSVLPSLDKVNQQLRARLGEALATVSNESKPLEEVATKNLDALRAYSLAMDADSKGDFKQAITLYRQAISIDADFALAHLDLGSALIATSAGDNTEAIGEIRKAAALTDRLSTRDALHAQALLTNYENPRAALEKWQMLDRLYPDYTPASGELGFYAYYTANRFDLAIAATERNATSMNPHRGTGDYLLGALYLGNERYADSKRRFELAVTDGVVFQDTYYAYLYAAQRQFDRADETLRAGKPSGIASDDAKNGYSRTTLAVDRGNWDEARKAATSAAQETIALAGTLHEEYTLVALSLQTLSQSNVDAKPVLTHYVRTQLSSPTRDTPDTQFNLMFAAYLAAHAGDIELATSTMSAVAPVTRNGDYPYLSSLLVVVQAELACVNGHPEEAIAKLKQRSDGSEYYFSHRVLMDAYAAQGDFVNAMAQAHWLATHRGRAYVEQFGQGILESFNVALSDLALLDEAEMAVRANHRDAARAAREALHEAWPHADQLSFLQPRLRALNKTLDSKPSAD